MAIRSMQPAVAWLPGARGEGEPLRSWTAALAGLVFCSALTAGEGGGTGERAGEPVLARIPPRPRGAITGSQFATRTAAWSERDRQRAALDEIERGNLPRFLNHLRPVDLRGETGAGDAITATIWVTPDYLALGPDRDFLYMPMSWPSATEVAQRFGCVLPTPKMVDAIYAQSRVHLEPRPLPAGSQMRSNAYFERHQRLIDAQRAGIPIGTLVAGHKKDVVLSDRLFDRPDREAIYGWHRLDGSPIQPLSTLHGVRYADYSHGVRLVWHQVWIDGAPREITEVLADSGLAPVLSDEGAIRDPVRLLDPQRAALAAFGGGVVRR